MTAWTFFKGEWHEGNPMIMGPMTHAPWLGSCVFDGARSFEGVAPDLDLHCQRVVRSAETFGLRPMHQAGAIEEMAREGIAKFPKGAGLYIRPMFWAEEGFVAPEADSTQFSITVHDSPLPQLPSFSVCLSSFRRPSYETFPTDAKAACHYPNSARAMREAKAKGFDNAVMLDPMGHVAELAIANIFYARDGVAHTPIPNGTFLDGITRQRTIQLLRKAGITVHERTISWDEVMAADEVFFTGNFAKVVPITRTDDRELQPGPIAARARELYWEFAHAGK